MERSADEARAANIAAMGQDLGEVYSALWQELARLFTKWGEHVELFGTREERVDLLNEAAPDFAGKLQDSQWREILLDIACLTDAPKIGKYENLSVQSLPDLIADQKTKQAVAALVDTALGASTFARDWRNKYLAHRDKARALGKAQQLPGGSRKMVRDALDALAAILNAVSSHYLDSTSGFDIGGGPPGGALNLLYVIDDGVRAERQKRARLQSGDIRPDDYAPRDV